MNEFQYCSGQRVETGDIIVVIGKRGIVDKIFPAQTAEARDWSCFDTGGLLLKFEDGDLQVWPWINEDLKLIARTKRT
jgi:hypothetical protein